MEMIGNLQKRWLLEMESESALLRLYGAALRTLAPRVFLWAPGMSPLPSLKGSGPYFEGGVYGFEMGL